MKKNQLIPSLALFAAMSATAEVSLTDGVIHTTGASSSADLKFAITLAEDAASLNIFIQGRNGDADLALTEFNGASIDCEVEKSGSNEACVIKSPKAGTYKFELSAHEAFDDVTVYASTQVYAQHHNCPELDNETTLHIQNPLITSAQIDDMCETLKQTEVRFHQLLQTHLIPVPNDQNGAVDVNIFANQAAYMTTGQYEQNMQDSASTGIYFETAPETSRAQANVNTFEALRWAGGEFYIWELAHEYVHYLDGRYNKQGDFNTTASHDVTWWTEGLAEYIADFESPYMNVELVHSPEDFSPTEIVSSGYDGQASPYDWGSLLVRYLIEKDGDNLQSLRQYMRDGEYADLDAWLATWATDHQSDFSLWQNDKLITDFKQRATELAIDESILATSQHGLLYYLDTAEGEAFTVSTSKGGGNVDIYLGFEDLPNKYNATEFLCRSNLTALNESCSIQSTEQGRYYVLLDAPGYAVFVNSQLDTTSTYTDTGIDYQLCATEVPYSGRNANVSTKVSLANDSSTNVKIYWLNNSSGARSASSYASLAPGESWNADWYLGDTFVVTDTNKNCLTTQALASGNNTFSFNGSDISVVTPPAPEPEPEAENNNSSGGSFPIFLTALTMLSIRLRRKN